MMQPETLDCQDCGTILLILYAEQARKVALRPYDFIIRCLECRRMHEADLIEQGELAGSEY